MVQSSNLLQEVVAVHQIKALRRVRQVVLSSSSAACGGEEVSLALVIVLPSLFIIIVVSRQVTQT